MAKQTSIPGTEDPEIPELTEAADRYVGFRDKWMKLGVQMRDASESLLEAMKKNKRKVHHLEDGSTIEIIAGKAKVKVRAPKEDAEDEE